MKGYWHQRLDTSRTRNTKGGQQLNFSTVDGEAQKTKCEQDLINQSIEANLTFLKSKQAKLNNVVQKMTKVEDFYQIVCSGDFVNMGIRCFQHNCQIIVYCMKDRQLLCPNCIYIEDKVTKQPDKKKQKAPKSIQPNNLSKSRSKSAKKKVNNSNQYQYHAKHEVKQINKVTAQIANDVKSWQVQLQQKLSQFNYCELQWNNLRVSFDKMNKNLMVELDKQFDNMQMEISKRYSQIKKQLKQMEQKYESHLQKIISHHKLVKRLIIPNRYPVPCVKHCWLQCTKKILQQQISLDPKQIASSHWMKHYQTNGKNIINKLSKKKKQPI